ncbi:hypothetical protein IWW34DRAFT_905169 [Fusarium oxysporum f. sp. albedinis]|nr:hypothetical protein IWW34DRAFT_905169 [Fusarium oxysporum f. sp. albedinis]
MGPHPLGRFRWISFVNLNKIPPTSQAFGICLGKCLSWPSPPPRHHGDMEWGAALEATCARKKKTNERDPRNLSVPSGEESHIVGKQPFITIEPSASGDVRPLNPVDGRLVHTLYGLKPSLSACQEPERHYARRGSVWDDQGSITVKVTRKADSHELDQSDTIWNVFIGLNRIDFSFMSLPLLEPFGGGQPCSNMQTAFTNRMPVIMA